MAKMLTTDGLMTITRTQLKALLNETTALDGMTSLGGAMEYTIRMLDGSPVTLVLGMNANTENGMIVERGAELAQAEREAQECPVCGGDGYVYTRHPELDDVAPSGEAWLNDPCTCPAGEAWQDRIESEGADWEERRR